MKKILFIINPVAGGGRAKHLVSTIKESIEKTDIEYNIALTTKPKDATNITKKGIEKGYTTLVAVGGDGTINEVAMGILESGSGTLGIIPSGTGNDLARTLDIPFEPKKAIDILINGSKKNIDVGLVNNNLFLNIASVGLDSEVVKNTEKFKKRIRSRISYIIGVLNTLFIFRDKKIKLEIDDISMDKSIFLVAVGNGRYYGGGLQILPMAITEDGYFHVCVINRIPKTLLLFLFPSIFKGNHIKFKKYVEIFKAKKIRIITDEKAYLNVDGEIYNIEKETLFTIDNKRLAVFC